MAITFVQQTVPPAGGSNSSFAFSITSTNSGDLLVACCALWNQSGSSVASISGIATVTGGATSWSKLKAESPNTGLALEIWYAANVPAGVTGLIITYTGGSGTNVNNLINVSEWSGVAAFAADKTNANGGTGSGTSQTETPGSITTTNSADLIIGAYVTAMASTGVDAISNTTPTNYTKLTVNSISTSLTASGQIAPFYWIPGALETTNPSSTASWLTSKSYNWAAVIASGYSQLTTTQTITGQSYLTGGAATVQQQLMMMGVGS